MPAAYRVAVTPRTAFEKSYSGRIVSSSEPGGRAFLLLFFILFSFISSCQPSTSDSRPRRPLGLNEKTAISYEDCIRLESPDEWKPGVSVTDGQWWRAGDLEP